ncbi:MAG: hypothetical protein GF353_18250 [Candidatus Lokiarchaeota archaeon]|nr:hypothetical protein [Candidatus Lokiarchaeota archaeon]
MRDEKDNSNDKRESDKGLRVLAGLLTESGLETRIVKDIIRETWEKIFVNVGINAFGALTRLKNGELLSKKGIKRLMGVAVREAIEVAKLKNLNLSEINFVKLTYDVARKTSDNVNSMLQDVLKKKRTEIDFINGKIVEEAKKLGINTPINDLLTQLIKGLEISNI